MPPTYLLPHLAEQRGLSGRIVRRLRWLHDRIGTRLIDRGFPPALLRYRFRQTVAADRAACGVKTVHPVARDVVPLAGGFDRVEDLPAERGWWPFSFREVTQRKLEPTCILTFADARVMALRTGPAEEYTPALIDRAGRAIAMREMRYRPDHGALARRKPDLALDDALWIAERVFDNYSHWLTAHLPKLVLMRDRGELAGLVLPAGRPAWLDTSLRRVGIDPDNFAQLPSPGVLAAGRLRVIGCDRFRPELLTAAREAVTWPDPNGRSGRVFVSRRQAKGRTLLEEGELEPLLRDRGFELVAMERLSFDGQVELMARTKVLLAPHGAGLANMLFCPPGALNCEIADPAYPNPNFYAMSAALGHHYHYIAGRGVGARHPLRQDLSVSVEKVRTFLDTLA